MVCGGFGPHPGRCVYPSGAHNLATVSIVCQHATEQIPTSTRLFRSARAGRIHVLLGCTGTTGISRPGCRRARPGMPASLCARIGSGPRHRPLSATTGPAVCDAGRFLRRAVRNWSTIRWAERPNSASHSRWPNETSAWSTGGAEVDTQAEVPAITSTAWRRCAAKRARAVWASRERRAATSSWCSRGMLSR